MLLAVSSTFPGAVIMYNCSEGFQPGTIQTSVCGDNGLWDPNPTLYTCRGYSHYAANLELLICIASYFPVLEFLLLATYTK